MATDVTSVTKSLDRIADALEGQSGGGSSEGGSSIFRISWHKVDESGRYGLELNKTANEILEALENGMTPVIFGEVVQGMYDTPRYLAFQQGYSDSYSGTYSFGFGVDYFSCASGDDYPYLNMS